MGVGVPHFKMVCCQNLQMVRLTLTLEISHMVRMTAWER